MCSVKKILYLDKSITVQHFQRKSWNVVNTKLLTANILRINRINNKAIIIWKSK